MTVFLSKSPPINPQASWMKSLYATCVCECAPVLVQLDYCNDVFVGLLAAMLAPLEFTVLHAVQLVKYLKPFDRVTVTLTQKDVHGAAD